MMGKDALTAAREERAKADKRYYLPPWPDKPPSSRTVEERVAALETDLGERIAELERQVLRNDYNAGYRRGYADGRAGLPPRG